MKKILAICIVLALPLTAWGCIVHTTPPPDEPAAAPATEAPAATPAPAPAEPAPAATEEPKKTPFGVPNLSGKDKDKEGAE
ncbi:MAG: hypothetical protein ACOC1F_13545 [Myxococcota bacterium]